MEASIGMTWGGEILDKHVEHIEERSPLKRLWLKLRRRPTELDVTVIDRIRLDWVAIDWEGERQYVGSYHGKPVYVDPDAVTDIAAMCPTTRIVRPLRPTDGGGF